MLLERVKEFKDLLFFLLFGFVNFLMWFKYDLFLNILIRVLWGFGL